MLVGARSYGLYAKRGSGGGVWERVVPLPKL